MNLKEDCRNNELTLLAMHRFVQEAAFGRGLSLEGPLSRVCELAGGTQVYERKRQIEDALEETELARPGRPARSASQPANEQVKGLRLNERVLRYRLDHPGAVVIHARGRAGYSDGFIRFILDLFDELEGPLERFCRQAKIPFQTLRHWGKRDRERSYEARPSRPCLSDSGLASDEARRIAED